MTDQTPAPDVHFSIDGCLGRIHLDRPKALNALTLDQIRRIDPQLRAWASDDRVRAVVITGEGEKAFCAGGDIRMLWDASHRGDNAYHKAFFGEEYRLNRLIKTFPKPYVAIVDGITMGGGVGLSVHGSHRVATERTMFAMPETGIGMFPDVGGTWFLPRCPGRTGYYLALTGETVSPADAMYAGAVTHHVPSARIEDLLLALDKACAADDRDTAAAVTWVLDAYNEPPESGELEARREGIDRHFAHGTVDGILASLDAGSEPWAVQEANKLRTKSPMSLRVTLRQMHLGLTLDFDGCMRLEYRIAPRIAMTADFREGIRAQIVDKDRNPKWDPDTLAAVPDAWIEGFFAPLDAPDTELTFTDAA